MKKWRTLHFLCNKQTRKHKQFSILWSHPTNMACFVCYISSMCGFSCRFYTDKRTHTRMNESAYPLNTVSLVRNSTQREQKLEILPSLLTPPLPSKFQVKNTCLPSFTMLFFTSLLYCFSHYSLPVGGSCLQHTRVWLEWADLPKASLVWRKFERKRKDEIQFAVEKLKKSEIRNLQSSSNSHPLTSHCSAPPCPVLFLRHLSFASSLLLLNARK